MKMDVTPLTQFLLMFLGVILVLIVAIIVGSAGPQVYERTSFYAYDCPNDTHIWNPDVCAGVTLRDGNQSFIQILPQMHLFNKLWILDVKPYKWDPNQPGFERDLSVSVSLWGTNDDLGDSPVWKAIRINDVHESEMICTTGDIDCDTFLLIDEQFLQFSWYQFEIKLPASSASPFVGDVEFSILRYTKGFGDVEIAYRTIFLFIILIVLVWYIWRLKKEKLSEWTFEQKCVLVLLAITIFYNDPFYGFTFLSKGWFFEFLNSVFETCFIAGLLLFWLIVIDKIRMDQLRVEPSYLHVAQFLVVGIYALLTLILFAWARIRAAEDPVYSERGQTTGILVLFWFVSAIYGAILVWLIVLVVMTIPIVNNKKYLLNRFIFIGLPTILCIFSVIVGIFTGTLGPFNRTSLGFTYFLNLYNSYVWILVAGVWPVATAVAQKPASTEEPNEESEISKFHDAL